MISKEYKDLNNGYGSFPCYETTINSFIQSDLRKINDSPFIAFNNSPFNFVDLDGHAPLSAMQILTSKFGDERSDVYQQLDHELDAGLFGRINEGIKGDYYLASKQVESNIGGIINKTIGRSDELITRDALRDLKETYMSGRRNRFIEAKDLPYKLSSEGTYTRRFRDPIIAPERLNSLAADAFLEGTNVGQELYAREIRKWDNMPQNVNLGRIYERPQMYMERNPTGLNAAEMAELYGADEYLYVNLFRGVMNARDNSGFRVNASHPNGFQADLGMQSEPINSELYQQFRQQNITLFGDEGRSEVTVPFRRYTFLE